MTVDDPAHSPLDFDSIFVGRDHELTTIRRLIADAPDATRTAFAAISGPPGIGKSRLIRAVTDHTPDTLIGHGTSRTVAALPNEAAIEALDGLVQSISGMEPDRLERWQLEVHARAGVNLLALRTALPTLAPLVPEPSPHELPLLGAMARERFDAGVRSLVDATVEVFGAAVFVFDDLQWADAATLATVRALLDRDAGGVTVLGAHRAGEFDTALLGEVDARCRLDPLGPDDVAAYVTGLLGNHDGGDAAAVVSARTGGNPFFLQQFMRRSLDTGAISFDLGSVGWHWSQERLADQPATENVGALLAATLSDLDTPHRRVIAELSCIGGPFSLADAIAISAAEGDLVAEALWTGQDRGLLRSTAWHLRTPHVDHHGRWDFTHDHVVRAAGDLLLPAEQADAHHRYGTALLSDSDRHDEALEHLLLAAERLSAEEIDTVAAHAVAVGAAQQRQGSFAAALHLYERTIALLGPDRWESRFDRSLDLHRAAVGAAWGAERRDVLTALNAEAVPHARTPIERAQLEFPRLQQLMVDTDLDAALDLGLGLLRDLDVKIEPTTSPVRIGQAVMRTARRLRRFSDDELRALPPCTDPATVEAQRILAELLSTVYVSRPELIPSMVLPSVNLTLDKGFHELSPVALAGYGLLQVALAGELGPRLAAGRYDTALRYGDLAVELADRPEARRYRPWTWFLYLNFIRHWRDGLRECLPASLDRQAEALEVGDLEYAGYLAAVHTSQLFTAGVNGPDFDRTVVRLLDTIPSQEFQSELCEQVRQNVHCLAGLTPDPFVLAGTTTFDETAVIRRAEAEDPPNMVALGTCHLVRFGLYFWGGRADRAIDQVRVLDQYIEGLTGTTLIPLIEFVRAMSQVAAPDHPDATPIPTLRAARRRMRPWAERAPDNYRTYLLILDAEHARARGRTRQAERAIDEAIEHADLQQNGLLRALSRERAAKLYHATGRDRVAEQFMEDAVQIWMSHGVVIRVRRLLDECPWYRGPVPEPPTFDTVGAVEAAEPTLSSGLLPDLAAGALRDMAKRVDADTTVLCVVERDAIELRAFVQADELRTIAPGTDLNEVEGIDRSVIRRAVRLAEPAADRHSDKATLALPIDSHGTIVAVVSFERINRKAFTAPETRSIELLADPIATVIDRARLARQLQETVESHDALEAAQARFVPSSSLRAIGLGDLTELDAGASVQRDLTVFLSDIRNYTGFSETADGETTRALVRDFFQAAETAIEANGGFIHDLRGDEVLALFARPEDGLRAAEQTMAALERTNARRAASGQPEVGIGIGLNHGPATLAVVGGVNRQTVGVFGDVVNLAARVEALTRDYEPNILMTDSFVAALDDADAFDLTEIATVSVKNRTQPVTLYRRG